MKKYKIVTNENLKDNLNTLKNMGYDRIIKAKDNFLTGWGYGSNNGHLQLIACNKRDMYEIIDDLKNDGYMTCINWYIIDDFKNISATTRGKTFTLRNDWVNCFTNKKGGIL